jgi:hypothetical protein
MLPFQMPVWGRMGVSWQWMWIFLSITPYLTTTDSAKETRYNAKPANKTVVEMSGERFLLIRFEAEHV